MDPLALDVRLDGFDDPVGVFVRDERGAVAFGYNRSYLTKPDATPLSLPLPLAGGPYSDVAARAFFDNLLQERDDIATPYAGRPSQEEARELIALLGYGWQSLFREANLLAKRNGAADR